ncbi:hypothetical protein WICPIJ_010026 [Wickerhamomyces pijperi]|uniref:PX domain-containing protein n=1 Tax=Wickerhamomyces pijperi TaxID=599730 RepID=A0A9P8PIH5_WICPI|nr:hypothetical protein WICPIJ_010026 [Wickerhamomyces pijperi]
MSFHEEEDNNPFSPPAATPENSIHSAFHSDNQPIEEEEDTSITQVDDDGFTDLPLSDGDISKNKNKNKNKNQQSNGIAQSIGTTLGEPIKGQDQEPSQHLNGDKSDKVNDENSQTNATELSKKSKDNSKSTSKNKNSSVLTTTVAYDPDAYTSKPTPTPTRVHHQHLQYPEGDIEITDASKSHEGATRGYVVYTILHNGITVRRRYSEFESLRKILTKLHPTLIIPPIPEKHSLGIKDITASVKGKAKTEEMALVEHRRRMLLVFLKRCFRIQELRNGEWLGKFLDPNFNWNEVLKSPLIINLPKNPLLGHPIDPAESSTPGHVHLPVPSNLNPLYPSNLGSLFNAKEESARDYEELITNGISKTHKRLTRHLSHLSQEYSELGGALNGFSLTEPDLQLAASLEHIGQTYDASYLQEGSLFTRLIRDFNEPVLESTQFASILRDLLKFRQLKSQQLDILTRSLKSKIGKLKELEKLEKEASKLDQALKDNEGKTGKINFDRTKAATLDSQTSTAASSSYKLKIPSLSTISTYITKTIDPSTATSESTTSSLPRPEQIRMLRAEITTLKASYQLSTSDVKLTDEAVTKELQRFQRERDDEWKGILKQYCASILEWSRGELELWKELKSVT